MKKLKYIKLIIGLILCSSCMKDFLEVKSDAGIGTPYQLTDYQAMMDNSANVMNAGASRLLNILGADEYYLSSSVWESWATNWHKNAYIWAEDVYDGKGSEDYNKGYLRILYCNLVLEGLQGIERTSTNGGDWDNVKGSALFFRANNYYQLAQLFAPPYNESTKEKDPGLRIRLESDVTAKSKFATLGETYALILQDLNEALSLLPDKSKHVMRPSKPACYGLLARVYLLMGKYAEARDVAEEYLTTNSSLLDYNTLKPQDTYPFPSGYGAQNSEVLFFNYSLALGLLSQSRMHVDPGLLNLYEAGDLRKSLFYKTGTINNSYFRGSYYGGALFFVGISTPEILLIRAETNARLGDSDLALKDINWLRKYRFSSKNPVNDIAFSNTEKVLEYVLDERRRELAFRGLRWEDLRRLNKDPKYATDITRDVNGTKYVLKANSAKYVWPLGDDVLSKDK